MQIHFDTESLHMKEAQGVILLLSALFPTSDSQQAALQQSALQQSAPQQSNTPNPTPVPTSGPALVQDSSSSTTEATKRVRRTKAQIEADEAAAKQAEAQDAVPNDLQTTTAQTQSVVKPIAADELRQLLNLYIAKNSMEEAIAILQSFGCGRVTEALALEPAKLSKLAGQLRG